MSNIQTDNPKPRKPLRLWPGAVLGIFVAIARFVLPIVAGEATIFGLSIAMLGVMGGMLGALAIVLWWLFFSRAPWVERIGAIVLATVALAVTERVVHPSIAGGMMGRMLPVYAFPVLTLALVVWAVSTRRLTVAPRRVSMAAATVITCAAFTLLRTDGIRGVGSDFHWRWTATPEERLLAQADEEPKAPPPAPPPVDTPAEKTAEPPVDTKDSAKPAPVAPAVAAPAKIEPPAPAAVVTRATWPGFRGPGRNSVIPGVRIKTDWSQSPPVEMWRRPIGPGWSSFAVSGDLIYTQEQRGPDEIVAAYNAASGKPVWRHRDPIRFWESNAGAGPRATPTLSGGRVYTMGATGVVNALDASSGARIWSRNAAADTDEEIPMWGFAGSPLVVGHTVIVAVSGRLIAYDALTGKQRWIGPPEGAGYSSPHLMTIDGVDQVLLLRGRRTTSVAPADGKVLWEHSGEPSVSIVQPARTADGDVLLAHGDGMGSGGIRRVAVAHGSDGWTLQERWNSRGLKPYFNDFVVHKGLAFGFDGSILSCIDLQDGARKWKGGRYGNGQMILLAEQDLLLVVSEEGELALVKATPDQFTEVARFKAIEGKTWNHPVLVGNVLLVRNGEEMAAFRLP
ncbi:MAG TPA: PQQ-binding-like beta-propeller repeat protein [Vicinamibacterales bacterium]|jgi:outer membrane protein assembly factor BamB|nr:PQQ-binding-like beta-propeller repeat protein [Vicinamibacterales bacterium]